MYNTTAAVGITKPTTSYKIGQTAVRPTPADEPGVDERV